MKPIFILSVLALGPVATARLAAQETVQPAVAAPAAGTPAPAPKPSAAQAPAPAAPPAPAPAAQAPAPATPPAPAPAPVAQAPAPVAPPAPAPVPAAQAPAPAAAPAAPPAAAPGKAGLSGPPAVPPTYYRSLRITLNGKTKTAGFIGLDVQPSEGTTKRVWVRILPNTAVNAIATEITKEMTFNLSSDYKIKASGGRISIVAANSGVKPVAVSVAGTSLYGVSVLVDEE